MKRPFRWPEHAVYLHAPTVTIAPADTDTPIAMVIVQYATLGVIFNASELKADAAKNGGPLQAAIGHLNSDQLGLLLFRVKDRNLDGYVIRREDKKDKHGRRWYVEPYRDGLSLEGDGQI